MCMKNVNITIIPCREAITPGLSLIGVFDNIVAQKDQNGRFILPKFNLYVNMSILLPDNIETYPEQEAIKPGAQFQVRLVFSHLRSRKAKVVQYYDFTLNGETDACCPFWEFHHLITVDSTTLIDCGKHAIKAQIRKKTDNENGEWVTQAIHAVNINNPDSES